MYIIKNCCFIRDEYFALNRSLAQSVVIHTLFSKMSQQKLQQQQQKFADLFKQLDKSGDGVLTVQELKRGLKEVYGAEVDDKTCIDMFMGIDSDDDQKCTCDEFVKEMCKGSRQEAFKEKFNSADADGSGKLDKAEITRIVKEVNATGITEEEIEKIIAEVDKNNDGQIDYKEFMAMC
ncbi:hypothetical protein KUTeg_008720 [Tegillarca granosa]|uniref:EF-hand domain-containing protein n=1 Tax=Tegillarca granosa TaxID=220873 RepID=A0ABQ9F9X7_TEGGR|nr:hypothetical protein KUTeg_008720 [Tegillarca granosa]